MVAWTDEMDETLLALLNQGLSASAIGARFGVSRNAVLGRIHRKGIARTQTPKKQGGIHADQGRSRKRKLTPPKVQQMRQLAAKMRDVEATPSALLPTVVSSEREFAGVSLLELSHNGCKWPVNNAAKGEDHLFCNAERVDGRPYCEQHCCRAFQGFSARRPKLPMRRAA